MDGHRLNVLSVKWHPSHHGNFISGGWDNTVHMWDVREHHSVRFNLFAFPCMTSDHIVCLSTCPIVFYFFNFFVFLVSVMYTYLNSMLDITFKILLLYSTVAIAF